MVKKFNGSLLRLGESNTLVFNIEKSFMNYSKPISLKFDNLEDKEWMLEKLGFTYSSEKGPFFGKKKVKDCKIMIVIK